MGQNPVRSLGEPPESPAVQLECSGAEFCSWSLPFRIWFGPVLQARTKGLQNATDKSRQEQVEHVT